MYHFDVRLGPVTLRSLCSIASPRLEIRPVQSLSPEA